MIEKENRFVNNRMIEFFTGGFFSPSTETNLHYAFDGFAHYQNHVSILIESFVNWNALHTLKCTEDSSNILIGIDEIAMAHNNLLKNVNLED